jgi:uncharacterized membrane protein
MRRARFPDDRPAAEKTRREGQVVPVRIVAPLHPVFVHFSIALTSTSFAFDAAAALLGSASLAIVGWWTLAASTIATVGTIATGVSARLRLPMEEGQARAYLRTHLGLGPTFLGLLVAMSTWRASLWQDGLVVPWTYLAAMAAVVMVMAAQGYLGGELVYRFGADVRGRFGRLPNASDTDGALPWRPPSRPTRAPSNPS